MPKITKDEQIEAMADDVFNQVAEGHAVQLTPEQADALGAFEETALSVEDVEADDALSNGDPDFLVKSEE